MARKFFPLATRAVAVSTTALIVLLGSPLAAETDTTTTAAPETGGVPWFWVGFALVIAVIVLILKRLGPSSEGDPRFADGGASATFLSTLPRDLDEPGDLTE